MVKKIIKHGDHRARGVFAIRKQPSCISFKRISKISYLGLPRAHWLLKDLSALFVHSVLRNRKEQSYG